MTRLLSAAALLAVGLLTTSALGAGGTATTAAQPSSVSKPTHKKPPATATVKKKTSVAKNKKKASVAKNSAPATAPVTVTITDAWAAKFGDLGPAYIAAVTLAQSAKYDDAIKAFNALGKPDDPRVLNWIGFSLRKMGKVDEAMPYYDKALSKAPDFTPAHEYLGEAYLQLKDVTKAKDQLVQIEKLCGSQTCEEYKDLSDAIAKFVL